MKRKTIIIGANGYLGRNIAWYLYQKDVELMCYDIHTSSLDTWMNYTKLDITQKSEVDKVNFDCDYLYIFAGLTGTTQGFEHYEKYYNVNVIGLGNILDQIRKTQSKARIVFPSTRLVYKGKENLALVESDEKEPKTIYALNKIDCELLLDLFARTFGINYTIFRICVPYGHLFQKDYSYGTIGFFISQAKKSENITLYGTGNLKRTFTHVQDICSVIEKSIEYEATNCQIYNIGGLTYTLSEVATYISKVYHVGVKYLPWPDFSLKIETGDTIFNSEKLELIIGNSGYVKLEDSVL